MKRLSVAILAFILVAACSKKAEPSDIEVAAEKAGRAAKAKLDGQSGVKGLQIHDAPTPAPPEPSTEAAVAPAQGTSVEDAARSRVGAMMGQWKASKATGDKEMLAAATIWGHGAADTLDIADFNRSVEGFAQFRKEKSLDGPLGEFALGSTLRRVNGPEHYTVVDVTINGALYHMGVPDDANAIFWTF